LQDEEGASSGRIPNIDIVVFVEAETPLAGKVLQEDTSAEVIDTLQI
jgi:hypothetical protein